MAEKAIELFSKIERPDKIILSILFNACAQLKTERALNLGKKIYFRLSDAHRQSTDLLYSVFDMFIKCDDEQSAEVLFHQLNRDVICYGSMMKFYNDKDKPEKSLNLFQQMKEDKIEANEIIFVLLIDALSKIGNSSLSEEILWQMPREFLLDSYIQVALIDMWVSSIPKSIKANRLAFVLGQSRFARQSETNLRCH